MIVIALVGRKGSGKSVVAQSLCSTGRNLARVPFAHPLKLMLHALGLTVEQTDGSLKETPTPLLCGQTPRHAMQTLGTQWGREFVHPNLWVEAWRREVDARRYYRNGIVVEDCRFPNEVQAIRAMGGVIWEVVRPGLDTVDQHQSEAGIRSFGMQPDVIINNSGTLDDLRVQVERLFRDLKG